MIRLQKNTVFGINTFALDGYLSKEEIHEYWVEQECTRCSTGVYVYQELLLEMLLADKEISVACINCSPNSAELTEADHFRGGGKAMSYITLMAKKHVYPVEFACRMIKHRALGTFYFTGMNRVRSFSELSLADELSVEESYLMTTLMGTAWYPSKVYFGRDSEKAQQFMLDVMASLIDRGAGHDGYDQNTRDLMKQLLQVESKKEDILVAWFFYMNGSNIEPKLLSELLMEECPAYTTFVV